MKRLLGLFALLTAIALGISSCASVAMTFEDLSRSWKGIPATMSTYDKEGHILDSVKGKSFQFALDERFEEVSRDSDGGIIRTPGSVLLLTVGKSHVSHVGSSLLLAEDGLTPAVDAATTVNVDSTEPGVPWLNNLIEYHRNMWKGKSKTLMIRSQDDKPIAVYAAHEVEIQGTAVPQSTMFRIDGKRLLAYRVSYTIYDTDMLNEQ